MQQYEVSHLHTTNNEESLLDATHNGVSHSHITLDVDFTPTSSGNRGSSYFPPKSIIISNPLGRDPSPSSFSLPSRQLPSRPQHHIICTIIISIYPCMQIICLHGHIINQSCQNTTHTLEIWHINKFAQKGLPPWDYTHLTSKARPVAQTALVLGPASKSIIKHTSIYTF